MKLMPLLMLTGLFLFPVVTPVHAQQQIDSRVQIAWNRFYNFEELTKILEELVAEPPVAEPG